MSRIRGSTRWTAALSVQNAIRVKRARACALVLGRVGVGVPLWGMRPSSRSGRYSMEVSSMLIRKMFRRAVWLDRKTYQCQTLMA
eukprot:7195547-Prorocentrum_lima.AAC.1